MPISTQKTETTTYRQRTRHTEQSDSQARRQAEDCYRRGGLYGKLETVFETLLTTQILTTQQLQAICHVGTRTLQRYQTNYWLYSAPLPSDIALFFPHKKDDRLYTLSRASYELAKLQNKIHDGTTGYHYQNYQHDIFCNQVLLAMLIECRQRGWDYNWLGSYESRIYDASGHPLVAPDAFLIVSKQKNYQMGCSVEYHNEDSSGRAEDKVARYETVARSQNWRRYWSGAKPPIVLVPFTYQAVYTGYINALYKRYYAGHRVHCRYFCKSLQRVLDKEDPFLWIDLNARAKDDQVSWVNLLEETDLFEEIV